MGTILDIKNLRISFRTNNGRVKAVRGISFDVQKGETVAIVGESGSGKSVTARAVMGILAANSIVDGGEILYDGKDLLKIPEDEFHKIRGHRISMIFQDPLSSLNPIVRIGKQLTEAMILNGKASQKYARREFKTKFEALRHNMKLAMAGQNADKKIDEDVRTLRKFILAGIKEEERYNMAFDHVTACLSMCDGLMIEFHSNDYKAMQSQCKQLADRIVKIYNPFLTYKEENLVEPCVRELREAQAELATQKTDKAKSAVEHTKAMLEELTEGEAPNFFTLGYYLYDGKHTVDLNLLAKDIAAMNHMTREYLDDAFMLAFLVDAEKGIKYAQEHTWSEKEAACIELQKFLSLLDGEFDDRKLREQMKLSIHAVQKCINALDLVKESVSHTYAASIQAAVEAYIKGKKLTAKKHHTKNEKAQLENIDMDILTENLATVPMRVLETYQNQLAERKTVAHADKAVQVIDFLKEQSSTMVFRVSHSRAKIRAIELMEEVGIAEARKRYRQYPFQFSGGMRQRIVIAIALSSNPDILICDEPTTALDVTIQAQILDLINGLKQRRKLSVIFITHDLGVVANMADKICVMYAGKIVEKGCVDEVFYEPKHPYTWALLSSMPDIFTEEKLEAIPGTPPNMIMPPKGDAFAARNKYALKIDFEEEPPMFRLSETHQAATWLLHPNAPKVEPPKIVTDRIAKMKDLEVVGNGK